MALLCAALLAGCASNGPDTAITDSLITFISPDGSKRFRYDYVRGDTLQTILPYDQTEGFVDRRNRYYSAADLRKKNDRTLRARIDTALAESHYCREGYFPLDSLIGYNGGTLKGECREAASEADRVAFPNQTTGDFE